MIKLLTCFLCICLAIVLYGEEEECTDPTSFTTEWSIVFLSPRKIQLFEVRLDGIPLQLNYLIDEDQSIGHDGSGTHGPNTVITLLDETLTSYGLGERVCRLHSDNCAGQNKNRFVLAYLAWRVMTGCHLEITLMMQVAGHARCLIDARFGHIKKLYRRSDIDSLSEMAQVVQNSAYSNTAAVYMKEDGPQTGYGVTGRHSWGLKGISSYQHFRFSSTSPGTVFVKRNHTDQEESITLLKYVVESLEGLPAVIQPAGLSMDRAHYIVPLQEYKQIHPVTISGHHSSTSRQFVKMKLIHDPLHF